LNNKTVTDRSQIPNINEILDYIGRSKYFSTLDLASGFYQIQMDPRDMAKTAFSVENGHYEFTRMPFGLKNAPATFRLVMTSDTDRPIFWSRTLNEAETRYSTIEKEMLAIIWAVKYFRPYLYGNKFKVITDHKPLVWLQNFKGQNQKLLRWKLTLSEYDYGIIYKKGSQNVIADALSRIEPNILVNGVNPSNLTGISLAKIPLKTFNFHTSFFRNRPDPLIFSEHPI